ncbi:DNA cytosine methyltransferase (plasmid) [Microtetraspora malaysiensis]|uniref:DNA cytosine methyltransferase n=1 Tax=Microtetraspora malaysiensis TaxID=161358 RepID=UPI003D910665
MSILSLFAGPGGFDQGAAILGLTEKHIGYDIDPDACATARAAGFARTQADVRSLNPDDFQDVKTVIITSPCPTLSAAGKGTGRKGKDRQTVIDGISAFGDLNREVGDPAEYHAAIESVEDQRTALLLENIRWALHLPNVTTVICENVPGARDYWWEIAAELVMNRWMSVHVLEVQSEDLRVASNRKRVFLVACKDRMPDLGYLPLRGGVHMPRFDQAPYDLVPVASVFGETTMAQALGWPTGERVNTRGNRRTSGGNEFSADRPAWCLTGKARTWKRVSDGSTLTPAEAGLLNGFPRDYPWTGSSRTSIFQRIADVVSPVVSAAILGIALGIEWEPMVADYLDRIYRTSPTWEQTDLFDLAA